MILLFLFFILDSHSCENIIAMALSLRRKFGSF
jgi:hypothetical protein